MDSGRRKTTEQCAIGLFYVLIICFYSVCLDACNYLLNMHFFLQITDTALHLQGKHWASTTLWVCGNVVVHILPWNLSIFHRSLVYYVQGSTTQAWTSGATFNRLKWVPCVEKRPPLICPFGGARGPQFRLRLSQISTAAVKINIR